MIRINLLPFRATRKKENIRRQVFIFVSMFILVALVLVYYNMRLTGKIETLEEKVASTKKELKVVQKKAREVDRIKKEIAILEKKMNIITTLERNRTVPMEFLIAMSKLIVEKKMWLTRMDVGAGSVSMDGLALDNKTVAVFLQRLEETPLFKGVNLKKITQDGREGITLKKFNVECRRAPMS